MKNLKILFFTLIVISLNFTFTKVVADTPSEYEIGLCSRFLSGITGDRIERGTLSMGASISMGVRGAYLCGSGFTRECAEENDISDDEIFMLVTRHGYSLVVDGVAYTITNIPLLCEGGNGGCTTDAHCGVGKECRSGSCFIVSASACDSDDDCEGDNVCVSGECSLPSSSTCATDADCGDNNFCNSTGHECKPCSELSTVNVTCPGSARLLRTASGTPYCDGGAQPVCPVNAEEMNSCGGRCVCKTGYHIISGGSICVSDTDNRVCPTGMGYDQLAQSCITGSAGLDPGYSRKKGGCSLVR